MRQTSSSRTSNLLSGHRTPKSTSKLKNSKSQILDIGKLLMNSSSTKKKIEKKRKPKNDSIISNVTVTDTARASHGARSSSSFVYLNETERNRNIKTLKILQTYKRVQPHGQRFNYSGYTRNNKKNGDINNNNDNNNNNNSNDNDLNHLRNTKTINISGELILRENYLNEKGCNDNSNSRGNSNESDDENNSSNGNHSDSDSSQRKGNESMYIKKNEEKNKSIVIESKEEEEEEELEEEKEKEEKTINKDKNNMNQYEEKINHISTRIDETMKKVFTVYEESNKRQYISRLFQMRDINCIFNCTFFALLLIFFITGEYLGVFLTLLLLILSVQLKFSRSFITLLNSVIGLLIISVVSIFTYFQMNYESPTAADNLRKSLLCVEIVICSLYVVVLLLYMTLLNFCKRLQKQHSWIFHNAINFFNVLDLYIMCSCGILGFFFIFCCFHDVLFIIISLLVFLNSFFIYITRKYTNVAALILQLMLLLGNTILSAVFYAKYHNTVRATTDTFNTNIKSGLNKIYLFYMVFTAFFFVFHLLYVYYTFSSKESSFINSLTQRKVLYSNIHPYFMKDGKNNDEIHFEYEKFYLYVDPNGKITKVDRKRSCNVDVNYSKYVYSDLHLYKHILLKTAYDLQCLFKSAYRNEQLIGKSRKQYFTYDKKYGSHCDKKHEYNYEHEDSDEKSSSHNFVININSWEHELPQNDQFYRNTNKTKLGKGKNLDTDDDDDDDNDYDDKDYDDDCEKQGKDRYEIKNVKRTYKKSKKIAKKYSQILLQKVSSLQEEKEEKKRKDINNEQIYINREYYFTNCKNSNYYTPSLFNSKYTNIIASLLDSYEELCFYFKKKMQLIEFIQDSQSEKQITYFKIDLMKSTENSPFETFGRGEMEIKLKEENTHPDCSSFYSEEDCSLTKETKTKAYTSQERPPVSNMLTNIMNTYEKQERSISSIVSKSVTTKSSEAVIESESNWNSNSTNANKGGETVSVSNESFSLMKRNVNDWDSQNTTPNAIPCPFGSSNEKFLLYMVKTHLKGSVIENSNASSIHSNTSISSGSQGEYLKIPFFYSSAKISVDEETHTGAGETCFWYYNPGIIARVYTEWLKCKKLDPKKFHNDFYHLFSNSDNLNDYLKSNSSLVNWSDGTTNRNSFHIIENEEPGCNLSVARVENHQMDSTSSENLNIFLKKIKTSSLDEVISNFLTNKSTNVNLSNLVQLNSKHFQSFLEDSNIRQFLESTCNGVKTIDDIKQGQKSNSQQTRKEKNDNKMESESVSECGSDKLSKQMQNLVIQNMLQSHEFFTKAHSKDLHRNNKEDEVQHIRDKNNEEQGNEHIEKKNALTDLLTYAEMLVLENGQKEVAKATQETHETRKQNAEKQQKNEEEKTEIALEDGTNAKSVEIENTILRNFMGHLKCKEENESSVEAKVENEVAEEELKERKTLYSSIIHEKDTSFNDDYDGDEEEDVLTRKNRKLLNTSENMYHIFKNQHYNEDMEKVNSLSNKERESFYASVDSHVLAKNEKDKMQRNEEIEVSASEMKQYGKNFDLLRSNLTLVATNEHTLEKEQKEEENGLKNILGDEQENAQEKEHDNVQEYVQGNEQKIVQEDEQENGHDNVQENKQENVQENVQENKQENVQENVQENIEENEQKKEKEKKTKEETEQEKDDSFVETRELKSEMINALKKKWEEKKKEQAKMDVELHRPDDEKKRVDELRRTSETKNGEDTWEQKKAALLSEKEKVESYCIYSNDLNDVLKKDICQSDEEKYIDYEKQLGFDSDCVKRIEEKNELQLKFSSDSIGGEALAEEDMFNELEQDELVKHLKDYFHTEINQKGKKETDIDDDVIMEQIVKYIKNNEYYNINIFNEIILKKKNEIFPNENNNEYVERATRTEMKTKIKECEKLNSTIDISQLKNMEKPVVKYFNISDDKKKETIMKPTISMNSYINVNGMSMNNFRMDKGFDEAVNKSKNETTIKTKNATTNETKNETTNVKDNTQDKTTMLKEKENTNGLNRSLYENQTKSADTEKKESVIKKADLDIVFHDQQIEIHKKDSFSNSYDSASDKKNIYWSNKDIFNKIYGFHNGLSDTSSVDEIELAELKIGNDRFYESFAYKSVNDFEDFKRKVDELRSDIKREGRVGIMNREMECETDNERTVVTVKNEIVNEVKSGNKNNVNKNYTDEKFLNEIHVNENHSNENHSNENHSNENYTTEGTLKRLYAYNDNSAGASGRERDQKRGQRTEGHINGSSDIQNIQISVNGNICDFVSNPIIKRNNIVSNDISQNCGDKKNDVYHNNLIMSKGKTSDNMSTHSNIVAYHQNEKEIQKLPDSSCYYYSGNIREKEISSNITNGTDKVINISHPLPSPPALNSNNSRSINQYFSNEQRKKLLPEFSSNDTTSYNIVNSPVIITSDLSNAEGSCNYNYSNGSFLKGSNVLEMDGRVSSGKISEKLENICENSINSLFDKNSVNVTETSVNFSSNKNGKHNKNRGLNSILEKDKVEGRDRDDDKNKEDDKNEKEQNKRAGVRHNRSTTDTTVGTDIADNLEYMEQGSLTPNAVYIFSSNDEEINSQRVNRNRYVKCKDDEVKIESDKYYINESNGNFFKSPFKKHFDKILNLYTFDSSNININKGETESEFNSIDYLDFIKNKNLDYSQGIGNNDNSDTSVFVKQVLNLDDHNANNKGKGKKAKKGKKKIKEKKDKKEKKEKNAHEQEKEEKQEREEERELTIDNSDIDYAVFSKIDRNIVNENIHMNTIRRGRRSESLMDVINRNHIFPNAISKTEEGFEKLVSSFDLHKINEYKKNKDNNELTSIKKNVQEEKETLLIPPKYSGKYKDILKSNLTSAGENENINEINSSNLINSSLNVTDIKKMVDTVKGQEELSSYHTCDNNRSNDILNSLYEYKSAGIQMKKKEESQSTVPEFFSNYTNKFFNSNNPLIKNIKPINILSKFRHHHHHHPNKNNNNNDNSNYVNKNNNSNTQKKTIGEIHKNKEFKKETNNFDSPISPKRRIDSNLDAQQKHVNLCQNEEEAFVHMDEQNSVLVKHISNNTSEAYSNMAVINSNVTLESRYNKEKNGHENEMENEMENEIKNEMENEMESENETENEKKKKVIYFLKKQYAPTVPMKGNEKRSTLIKVVSEQDYQTYQHSNFEEFDKVKKRKSIEDNINELFNQNTQNKKKKEIVSNNVGYDNNNNNNNNNNDNTNRNKNYNTPSKVYEKKGVTQKNIKSGLSKTTEKNSFKVESKNKKAVLNYCPYSLDNFCNVENSDDEIVAKPFLNYSK